ncbi:hypothetical protein RJ639_009804 [Escallonia herrerae]|uniref:Uncharacterized protein n=1 Tax=Escallonia herrerae TaxID=1293975 RepID=A0AA88VTN3_9ASTE|nr:hypothetical protein RJ639_010718 [Escallonia herrerae]KAK3013713.1 hypothetical protein RJ639_009804 [Escallonia herrerae]
MMGVAGVLGAALLCAIHGATVENTLFEEGIQLIEERCRENLQMIEDLLRLMHKSHIETHSTAILPPSPNQGCPLEALVSSSNVDTTRDPYLLDGFHLDDEYGACSLKQSLTVNPLIQTKEANMSSREVQGGAEHGAMLNVEPENEIINGDGALDDEEALTKHLESTRTHLACQE